jgi:hypothetical protein
MQWELLATWATLLVTIGTGIYKMGKQSQRIDDQQSQIGELKQKLEANKDIPIKLATLETDIKYLIQGMSELKQILMKGN